MDIPLAESDFVPWALYNLANLEHSRLLHATLESSCLLLHCIFPRGHVLDVSRADYSFIQHVPMAFQIVFLVYLTTSQVKTSEYVLTGKLGRFSSQYGPLSV
jgi:hypothetical protein